MFVLSQQKRMLTDGNLTFVIGNLEEDPHKHECWYILLNNIPVAGYSTLSICIYVLVLLADYLNQNDIKCFKFPSEEKVKEMIACTKK